MPTHFWTKTIRHAYIELNQACLQICGLLYHKGSYFTLKHHWKENALMKPKIHKLTAVASHLTAQRLQTLLGQLTTYTLPIPCSSIEFTHAPLAPFSFLPARRCASAGNSDRNVSVCLSVTRRYCVKTKKASGMISPPPGSPKTVVF